MRALKFFWSDEGGFEKKNNFLFEGDGGFEIRLYKKVAIFWGRISLFIELQIYTCYRCLHFICHSDYLRLCL